MKGFGTRTRFETEARFDSEIGYHTNCLSSVCMYKTARRTFSCKMPGSHIHYIVLIHFYHSIDAPLKFDQTQT